jgi:hypothetical protein
MLIIPYLIKKKTQKKTQKKTKKTKYTTREPYLFIDTDKSLHV